ncbi:MAG: VWA domain-containing protein [Deltaproteobacteria bacterium]|nr:VWA domain-containing protein [Deltaproteobacteria bacterium]
MEPMPRPSARAAGARARARAAAATSLALALVSFASCSLKSERAPVTEGAADKDLSGGAGTQHAGAAGMMGDPSKQPMASAAPTATISRAPDKTKLPVKLSVEGDSFGYGGLGTVGGFGHGAAGGGSASGMGYGGGGGYAAKKAMPPGVPLAFDSDPGAVKPSGGVLIAPAPPAAMVAPVPLLDPNARYATTYRPGGAALSAFDAALSRGALPAASKDLVGDFGARYSPALDAPEKGAMTFALGLERAAIGPGGGPLHLRVAMKGSEIAPLRAPLSVHVVLDVSGSMEGASIQHAREAAEALVQRLEPADHFSLVTFSNDAKVLVSTGAIGPRRAKVVDTIRAIVTDGGTNISSGLDLGYAQANAEGAPEDAVKVVMLLSDGHANGGDTNPRSLALRSARAFQEGVQTSTFGIGSSFDGALLSSIADQGAGAYYYLAEPKQIGPALSKELDARLQPVASALEIRVRLRPGIGAAKVYGSQTLDGDAAALIRAQEVAVDAQAQEKDGIAKDRKDDAKGGMRFFVPAFAKGDRHAMLLSLQVPAGTGEREIASVEVRFKDRLLKKNVTLELPVKLAWSKSDGDSAKTIDPSVQATVQAFAAGDAIWRAAEKLDQSDRPAARAILLERAAILRKAKDTLGDARLIDDAVRLERLADLVSGPSEIADPLTVAVLLRGSGSGYLR